MHSLVSIIIPTYNRLNSIEVALRSVLEQSYQNWECIIVNDGSTDDTDSIASKWSGSDERIVYIKQANGGVANARNNGVAKSKGEFILPLDADDYISSNYIETCVHEIASP